MTRSATIGLAIALAAVLTGCAASFVPAGTLRPDGQLGNGVTVSMVPSVSDGRAVAMTMANVENTSTTDSLTLISAELVDPDGMDIVDSFVKSVDYDTAVGQPVPPKLTDGDDRAEARTEIEHWKKRIPLGGYEFAPGGYYELALVVRPTTSEPCVWAKGFRIDYEQYGHRYTAVSNMAMIIYTGKTTTCGHVSDDLLAHPIS